MTVSASRVQYIWSPILGWALLTCSASMALAQIGVAVPGVSDTPITSSDQTTNSPGDQTGGASSSSTTGGLSPTVTPAPVARPTTVGDIALPSGTTVANPSTQLIPGLSDTFGGGANGISIAGFSGGGAPGGDELGISVGSFRLYPAIDITTGIDNNVFATNSASTTPSLSLSTVVAPSLALRSEWLNHSINFLAGGGFGFYASAPTQNYQNYFMIVDGKIDIREDLALVYSFVVVLALLGMTACGDRTTGVTQLPVPPSRDVVAFTTAPPANGPPDAPTNDCKKGGMSRSLLKIA